MDAPGLWNEHALGREQRVVTDGARVAVSAAVVDLDLAELPDRTLALEHLAGAQRVGRGGDGARRTDGGVGRRGGAWDVELEGDRDNRSWSGAAGIRSVL